jgi:hypothetical protein
VLLVAGVFLDPDIEASGRELAQAYAESPGREQVSALAFHFAFVMWAPVVFALVGLVRGRGAWLANLAAVLAVLGATAAVVSAQAVQPFGSGLLILAGGLLVLAYVFSRMDWRPREQPA